MTWTPVCTIHRATARLMRSFQSRLPCLDRPLCEDKAKIIAIAGCVNSLNNNGLFGQSFRLDTVFLKS